MPPPRKKGNGNGKRLGTQQSVNGAIKSICDIMRRSNCAGALQYVPELTWILFLRILDERETREAEESEAVGAGFAPSLELPYRWQDWAAPGGPKRTELQNGALGAFFPKGESTERIWYYDLSAVKVGKRDPPTIQKFEEFFRLLPEREDSEQSWTVSRADIEAKNYDLKAVNPNARSAVDTRTPDELLDVIETKGREVAEALATLRGLKHRT